MAYDEAQVTELLEVIDHFAAGEDGALGSIRNLKERADRLREPVFRSARRGDPDAWDAYRSEPQFPDGTPIPEDHHSYPTNHPDADLGRTSLYAGPSVSCDARPRSR